MALSNDTINDLLGVEESYKAPQIMMDKIMDPTQRKKLFDAFLEHETQMGYEWFQHYFESEHADRKVKKQDFTPDAVSHLMTELVGQDKTYFESTAGTGGIMIQAWQYHRSQVRPFMYDPRSYWYQVEELSDRSIPFLIFNMSIRGLNGAVLHGDSLTREFKDVYFIRNDSADFMAYSEVMRMPNTDTLRREFNVAKWG